MKNIIKFLTASAFFAFLFISCKKEVSQIKYEGGTAPVLTSVSADSIILSLATQNNPAITFNWTNPDYQLSTGLSSQNVSYTLQIDTVRSAFTNPQMAEISIANDQSLSLTIGELNDILVAAGKLFLAPNVPHDIAFRVKATLLNESVPLFSNVIILEDIVPYPDPNVPHLYITGDATAAGWTNAPPDANAGAASQEFTHLSGLRFEIVIHLEPGFQYKFLTNLNQWQPQWGGCGPDGGTLTVNPGGGTDPNPINTPAVAGDYKITVDLNPNNPNCTVVLQ